MRGPGHYGLGAPITPGDLVLPEAPCVACAVLTACRPGRPRRHSYRWLVPIMLAMAEALLEEGCCHRPPPAEGSKVVRHERRH